MPTGRTLTEAEREASGWIVRIKAHDVSERERQEFEAWRAADPANAAAYAKLERTWGVVASLQHLKGSATANDTAPRRRSWAAPAFAIAASLLIAIGAGVWFTRTQTPTGEHYATAPAQVRTLHLADGSTITLSGASDASVSLTANERRVQLTSGYALFDVVHDPSRPFVVHTPQGDIRDLGTSFVVRITSNEVRTTVLQGAVTGAAERQGALFAQVSRPVTAGANQEIVLRQGQAQVVTISVDALPRRLAWRDNMLAFDGETLNEAIAQVSQQTGWTFELTDPSIGELHIGGYIHTDPEAFIGLLSSSLNLEARREGERRVILSRRP